MNGYAYYNEFDAHAAAWLGNLMHDGLIAPGEIDTRSITDVRANDLKGFTRCHFFAGIGGWDYALQRAGWPDDRPVWTGSCPCQPFSLAGSRQGFDDSRHLWPQFARLIGDAKPATVFGEQVASATDWLGLVRGDLDAMGYAVGAMPIEAASAGADHLRDRFWFVADDGFGRRDDGAMADAAGAGSFPGALGGIHRGEESRGPRHGEFERCGGTYEWVIGADGKARRVKSGIRLLVNGVSGRVAVRRPVEPGATEIQEHWYNRIGALKGFGNAIDPRPASEFIAAFLETERLAT